MLQLSPLLVLWKPASHSPAPQSGAEQGGALSKHDPAAARRVGDFTDMKFLISPLESLGPNTPPRLPAPPGEGPRSTGRKEKERCRATFERAESGMRVGVPPTENVGRDLKGQLQTVCVRWGR